jgi:hypothetical protein
LRPLPDIEKLLRFSDFALTPKRKTALIPGGFCGVDRANFQPRIFCAEFLPFSSILTQNYFPLFTFFR